MHTFRDCPEPATAEVAPGGAAASSGFTNSVPELVRSDSLPHPTRDAAITADHGGRNTIALCRTHTPPAPLPAACIPLAAAEASYVSSAAYIAAPSCPLYLAALLSEAFMSPQVRCPPTLTVCCSGTCAQQCTPSHAARICLYGWRLRCLWATTSC